MHMGLCTRRLFWNVFQHLNLNYTPFLFIYCWVFATLSMCIPFNTKLTGKKISSTFFNHIWNNQISFLILFLSFTLSSQGLCRHLSHQQSPAVILSAKTNRQKIDSRKITELSLSGRPLLPAKFAFSSYMRPKTQAFLKVWAYSGLDGVFIFFCHSTERRLRKKETQLALHLGKPAETKTSKLGHRFTGGILVLLSL